MMGARYVQRVVALTPGELDPRFKDLPRASTIVLLVMASTSLDNDGKTAAGHYFGGWQNLAHALGYPNANKGTAGQRAVARAVNDLRVRGIVHSVGVVEQRRRWSSHVYALDL